MSGPITSERARFYLERAIRSMQAFRKLRRESAPWRSSPRLRLLSCYMVQKNIGRVRFWRARLAGALRREKESA
jgi:hypothetical protein